MRALLLVDLLIGGYNFGTIWAHEVDIFRSWRLVGRHFQEIQRVHWKKLPYWVLAPVGAGFALSIAMLWLAPNGSPPWGSWGSFGSQAASAVLTAATWGRWQASLARDPRGPESPYLDRILATHWIRTALYSANALIVLAWTVAVFG
ncbi:MAG: hypothetical protein ACTHJJ_18255 [Intrasporangium sp.]|uniref:hypothetical protein n=1 Tax=Intrasporangium sp. TaxID=1925024 RepID=UPI003F7D6B23